MSNIVMHGFLIGKQLAIERVGQVFANPTFMTLTLEVHAEMKVRGPLYMNNNNNKSLKN